MIESALVKDQLNDKEFQAELVKLIPQGMTVKEFLDQLNILKCKYF